MSNVHAFSGFINHVCVLIVWVILYSMNNQAVLSITHLGDFLCSTSIQEKGSQAHLCKQGLKNLNSCHRYIAKCRNVSSISMIPRTAGSTFSVSTILLYTSRNEKARIVLSPAWPPCC